MTTSGVYLIENTDNGHRYVGSAVNLDQRKKRHLGSLRRGDHHSPFLQRAWNKYGEGAFRFDVLEELEPEFLVSSEQWWMNMLLPEYNMYKVAGSPIGSRHTEETKLRISIAKKGSDYWTGRKHSEESKRKMSLATKGKPKGPFSDEHRRHMSEAQAGRKASSAQRSANSEAKKRAFLAGELIRDERGRFVRRTGGGVRQP